MDFSFTSDQLALKERIEEFLRENLSPQRVEELFQKGETHCDEFYQRLAEAGFIGLAWPREFGGSGGTRMDMAIFMEIMGYNEAPMGGFGSTVGLFAQSIIHAGTEEQKKEFLPRIARGEIICCLGITEPDAGSDAASVKTRAVEEGDHFVLNGTKVFITGAHLAHYMLTLARTDPSKEKHEGLTFFIVDLHQNGVEVRPIYTSSGWRVNEVFMDGVKVHRKYVVGEVNGAWKVVRKTLGMERVGLGNMRNAYRLVNELKDHVMQNGMDSDSYIRRRLCSLMARAEVARLLYYNASWRQDMGKDFTLDASVSKLFTSLLYHELAGAGLEILGYRGQVKSSSARALLRGRIEFWYRHCVASTIGGGTSQVQRNLISKIVMERGSEL